MSSLHYDSCRPLPAGTGPLERKQAIQLAIEAGGWVVSPDTASITRQFHFELFSEAVAFMNDVGKIALQQNHYPEMEIIGYDLDVRFSSPEVGGLSINDFIMAARISKLPSAG